MLALQRVAATTLVVGAFVALGSMLPAGAGAPATTSPSEVAELWVLKYVQGVAPADAEFEVRVECENAGSRTLTFGPQGGAEEVLFTEADSCIVTETETGGASQVSVYPEVIVISEPRAYVVEIANVFVSSDTSARPQTAPAAAVRPTFTG